MISRRSLLVLPALLVASGCESKKPAADASNKNLPRLAERPEDLLPAGLALVLRVDLERLRNVASNRALDPLREPLNRRLQRGEQASLLELLRARATTLWVGLRGVPSGDRLDAVLVARGDFASFDPSAQGGAWVRSPTMHPGRAVFERQGEAPRGVPSFLAVVENRILVLATPLEAPAVRRVLEQGPTPSSMEPPADGLLGVALKPIALAKAGQEHYPHLASVLTELTALELVLDLGEEQTGSLRADLRLSTRNATGTERVERVLLGWKDAFGAEDDPLARSLAKAAQVDRDGPQSVRVKLLANHEVTVAVFKALSKT